MSEWKKVKIDDICKIVKGTTGIASAEPGEYPLVVTAEERKTCSTYQFDCEAVCIPLVSSSGHGKKSLKNVHYQSGKFALGTILCAVIPNNPQELDACYLHQYLQFYKDIILVPLMKGAANVSLSMKDIATVEFPLPPIERQRELSNLFVSLQEKQKELSAEYEKQTDYAKLLRQNILQQAIEGNLTADWRKQNPVQKGNPDYDAEALFEQIQKGEVSPSLPSQVAPRIATASSADSLRFVGWSATPSAGSNAARNARSKSLTPITDGEKPFEISEGWKWVRLGDVCNIIGGYAFNSLDLKPVGENYILRLGNIRNNQIRYEAKPAYVSNQIIKNLDEYKAKLNDILLTMTGTRGKQDYLYSVIIKQEHLNTCQMFVNQRVCIIRPRLYPEFVYKCLHSDVLKNPIFDSATGSANQANIGIKALNDWAIPFPPLKEQEEIVNKVERLLAKVTTLENQIQDRRLLSDKLIFGIIKENLEG